MEYKKLKIAIVCRADKNYPLNAQPENNKFCGVIDEFERIGFSAEVVTYHDDIVADVFQKLSQFNGVLVWVNPIQNNVSRVLLDDMLKRISLQGIFVSAHPDVILKMGTKEILFKTKKMEWGSDTSIFKSIIELKEGILNLLASGNPLVVKRSRGNGGNGTWLINSAQSINSIDTDPLLHVLHAERNSQLEEIKLTGFISKCESYFDNSEMVIVQPFQKRLSEGMVRVYVSCQKVVGFGHQKVNALVLQPEAKESMPVTKRIYYTESESEFQKLKSKMESEWIPELMEIQQIDSNELPVIWDADFLLGEKNNDGENTYVLCEINVSSVHPFPESAIQDIANSTKVCMQKMSIN